MSASARWYAKHLASIRSHVYRTCQVTHLSAKQKFIKYTLNAFKAWGCQLPQGKGWSCSGVAKYPCCRTNISCIFNKYFSWCDYIGVCSTNKEGWAWARPGCRISGVGVLGRNAAARRPSTPRPSPPSPPPPPSSPSDCAKLCLDGATRRRRVCKLRGGGGGRGGGGEGGGGEVCKPGGGGGGLGSGPNRWRRRGRWPSEGNRNWFEPILGRLSKTF